MEQIGFECILPREEDAKLVMDWRNDPQTLAMSFRTRKKEWSSFYPEFKRTYFVDPELPPLFILVNGKRVGYVQLRSVVHPKDSTWNCCEVSIALAPEYRNKGIGTQTLEALKDWVAIRGYSTMLAEIKRENGISHKAFQKAGYQKLDEINKLIVDTNETVPIIRYLATVLSPDVHKPIFIIAEAGSNWRVGSKHEDLDMAHRLIDSAVDAGADAVKFQTYNSETLYAPNAGVSEYLSKVGISEDIRTLLTHYEMPYAMLPELASYCEKQRIEFMSTPFSPDDFRAVAPFVKRNKIASYEISHPHLIRLAAESGKPLILSTGASTEPDISWAVDYFFKNGGSDLTLLQCTAQYPAEHEAMNLRVIPWLKKVYGVDAGLSDHSIDPLYAPIAAVALGARVIEKHFTINRSLPGPDHAHSVLPLELKQMIMAVREVEKMLGASAKAVYVQEEELHKFACRSLQAIREISPGESLIEGENYAVLRPGNHLKGVHPRFLQQIEGCKVRNHIPVGDGIQMDDLS